MQTYNIYQAKTHFSSLVNAVQQGEEIIIAKFGKPVAKLVPMKQKKQLRKFGQLKGKIWIAKDFNELPEDFARYFS